MEYSLLLIWLPSTETQHVMMIVEAEEFNPLAG